VTIGRSIRLNYPFAFLNCGTQVRGGSVTLITDTQSNGGARSQ
jgi:hypothetical protein